MREYSDPTHILTVKVPLNQHADEHIEYDAYKQALDVCLAATVAAYDNVICGDIEVELSSCVSR